MKLLRTLSDAYYRGEPMVPDSVYDALERKYGNDQVGGDAGDVEHPYRMYSLDKSYGEREMYEETTIETPKLDGNAVACYYIEGQLALALTRGDGIKGHDITEQMRYLVPNVIRDQTPMLQVPGEVVALSSVTNSRNFVAGALGLKDTKTYESRIEEGAIKFVAYGLKGNNSPNYSEDMAYLAEAGFNSITSFDHEDYPKDGLVYRVNSNKSFETMGYTGKHPRGAFALKEKGEGVETIVTDIIWDVGRTGRVTPVAIFEPVILGDAKCTRASLHNPGVMKALGIYIGARVVIERKGEIIPQVTEVLD